MARSHFHSINNRALAHADRAAPTAPPRLKSCVRGAQMLRESCDVSRWRKMSSRRCDMQANKRSKSLKLQTEFPFLFCIFFFYQWEKRNALFVFGRVAAARARGIDYRQIVVTLVIWCTFLFLSQTAKNRQLRNGFGIFRSQWNSKMREIRRESAMQFRLIACRCIRYCIIEPQTHCVFAPQRGLTCASLYKFRTSIRLSIVHYVPHAEICISIATSRQRRRIDVLITAQRKF